MLPSRFRAMSAKSVSSLVVKPPSLPSVPVGGKEGSEFPIRRIYCVGKNYSDHVKEMGGDPNRSEPCFFTKPADAVVPCDDANNVTVSIPYALATSSLHYEIELVVAIGKSGVNITEKAALEHVYGYAAAVDLTRRDLQAHAKEQGLPWDSAKAFDQSAPISNIYPASSSQLSESSRIWLNVNGSVRQDGRLRQMVWSVPEIVSKLSEQFRLEPGDIILTGTPSGVGPLQRGDTINGGVEGLCSLSLRIE